MHRRGAIRLAIVSVSLFAIIACDANRTTDPASGRSPFGVPELASRTAVALDPDSPFGIDFIGNHINDNSATKTRAAQLMAQAGVRFARITVYWNYMEQGQSNGLAWWEQAKLDTTVNALISAGIEPYITLEGTACYAISMAFSDTTCTWTAIHHAPDTEAHWQSWPAYVQEMVQAYPQVHYWGVWNEPNSDFLIPWTGDRLTAYKRLVEMASPIIRAAGGKVIGPDLGDGKDSLNVPVTDARTWLSNFMAADGSLVDVVAVHYYGGLTTQDYVQTMTSLASVSGGKELWLTEVARGDWEQGVNDVDQAVNLATVYRAMQSGAVPQWKKTFYFNAGVFDSLANPGIVYNLGLSYSTRPAYDSLMAIAVGLPLSASVWGPSDVSNSPSCRLRFQATATGGAGGYSYAWNTDGVISEDYGDVVYAAFPDYPGAGDSRYIEVTVTDANGATTVGSWGVTAESYYDICYSD